jgi:hypothetical protein
MTQESTKTKATFPSVDWFNAVKAIVNNDDGYKRIGTCDTVMGVKVPDQGKYYSITFEAFEVAMKDERATRRIATSGWRCPTRNGRK